jgi:predicted RNA-binding Zn ribbon-like protein
VYPRLGLPLALELVNTEFAMAGRACDALKAPEDLREWLALNGQMLDGTVPTADELELFRALRTALRRLFDAAAHGAAPKASDVHVLNQTLAAAPRVERIQWSSKDARPRIHTVALAERLTAALAAVARSGAELLASGAGVRQCQAPGCVLFFTLDARRRYWCSAACGNRARVARHYSRHRSINNTR